MNVEQEPDWLVSDIAMAIGEPARVRILYCLLDGRARTSTELAAVAEVSPSTTSAHLKRLSAAPLVRAAYPPMQWERFLPIIMHSADCFPR